jgi:hypothetical protein
LLIASFLLPIVTTAQKTAQKKTTPATFAKLITPEDLKKHLYIIAGKDMEGRETASEGQRKAAAYIEGQFRRIGLLPGNNGSYQMNYPVYQDSLAGATFEVNGQGYQIEKDFNPGNGNISATMRFSEVVFIGANAGDSLKNVNLTGKLVMLVGGGGQGRRGFGVPPMLSNKGVSAILTVANNYPRNTPTNRKGRQTTSIFNRAIGPQQFSISENIARAITNGDYDKIKTNPAAVKTYSANILLDVQKTIINLQSSNVIGVLPGTDLKDQYLFITGHYDHLGKRDTVIWYGADDDGSGTVSVIEMAEAFAKAKAAGKGPRRTIVFMTVSGEEEGLFGSDYYTSHPIFPLEKTTADLNIDMIGRIDPDRKIGDSTNYVYVVGDDKLSSDLKVISEDQNNKNTKLELDYKYNDPNDRERIYFRSDHYNFARNGVPIIFYYDGMLRPDYHQPTDTPDKINYNLMAKRAQLVFYTGWEMANRDSMLKRDIPLPAMQR